MNYRSTSVAAQEIGLPSQEYLTCHPDDRILITGAAGFIGPRVLQCLLDLGFRNLLCFVRPSSDVTALKAVIERGPSGARIEVLKGNLLSQENCETASKDVVLVFHLAAGKGEKSFPDVFLNSVVGTRNLLDANLRCGRVRRFVLVSSFTVYTNCKKPKGRLLDESCPIEEHPELRGEAYCFAKVRQEQLVTDYGKNRGIPYVMIRPGSVYGEGTREITGRVGIRTFGPFLHLGGSNTIPFTYVENCAEAIVRAGLIKGIDGEIFNVVDDDLPTSRHFLRLYKRNAGRFNSIYVPRFVSYVLCFLWERYSSWSVGQLPPVFNRRRWHVDWKKTQYSNEKLKARLGWMPKVPTAEGLRRYTEASRGNGRHA
jgi:nucleoside-diphosphate-sugar epimerase